MSSQTESPRPQQRAAPVAHDDPSAPGSTANRGSTLVFAGDSITDAGRDRAIRLSLGDGYVKLIADALHGRGLTVVNQGVSGDRAVDLERRWRDVLAADPDVLTVYIGVNDMWRRFDAGDATSAAEFQNTTAGLLEAAVATGVEHIILIEPFFLPVREEQVAWLDDLDPKREAIESLAARFGASHVALQERMTAAAAEHGIAAIAPDGVHPAPRGSALIADAWLTAYSEIEEPARG
ncbi:GDSL-type esterase/lipase family protein [Galbitalea sp. SE-J8]|uniref:GDSL-type esterase/lipase family protein n=1 Tax=Galbitalea sp. SE-J8 TaxID=3054952 RepID=UPI00259CD61E|nr:GDSL-type esterase/lipase family protein [Galbitalea sp. SE-J8]MDM4762207.1 GDSL-type esterase/lipase family protein [Galbitalea sp. SE-J8]